MIFLSSALSLLLGGAGGGVARKLRPPHPGHARGTFGGRVRVLRVFFSPPPPVLTAFSGKTQSAPGRYEWPSLDKLFYLESCLFYLLQLFGPLILDERLVSSPTQK